jgi:hypothetical protein
VVVGGPRARRPAAAVRDTAEHQPRRPLADLIRKEAAFWRPLPIEKHGKGHTVGRLAKAGWATDPDYAHKLVTVANRIAAR